MERESVLVFSIESIAEKAPPHLYQAVWGGLPAGTLAKHEATTLAQKSWTEMTRFTTGLKCVAATSTHIQPDRECKRQVNTLLEKLSSPTKV
jgi:hypothetical protein